MKNTVIPDYLFSKGSCEMRQPGWNYDQSRMNKKLLAQPWEKSGISNTSYAYDGANRLSTVTLSQSSGHRMAGSENSVNENDAETSRDSVNEKDTAASRNAGKGKVKTTTVHFTYDGDGVLAEKSVTRQSKTSPQAFR